MNDTIELSHLIYRIRGRRVMLSADLARLYGVTPKALVQAVKRNRDRFPEDFLFQLSQEESSRRGPAYAGPRPLTPPDVRCRIRRFPLSVQRNPPLG